MLFEFFLALMAMLPVLGMVGNAARYVEDRDVMLDPPDAAEFVHLRPQTLAVWRMRGIGPRYIKVGRKIRYRLVDLRAWLDEQERGGEQ